MAIALMQSAPYLLHQYQLFAKEEGHNNLSQFSLKEPLLEVFCDEETVHRVSREYSSLKKGQYSKRLIEGCWTAFLKEDQNEMLRRLESKKSLRNQRLDYILYAGKKIKQARNTYKIFNYQLSKHTGYSLSFPGGVNMIKACCIALCFSPHDPFVVRDNLVSYVKDSGIIPDEGQFPDADILIEQYGSWDKTIDALQLAKMVAGNNISPEKMLDLKKEYLLERIWIKANELGRQPRFAEMQEGTTIQRTFGSWNNALIAAGYKPYVKDFNSRANIKSNEELELLLVEQTEHLNRLPLAREFKNLGVVLKRYGQWSKFLRITHEHFPVLWLYPEKKRSYARIPPEEWISMQTLASQFYERFVN